LTPQLMKWYGREGAAKVDRAKVWVRFSTQHVDDEQKTLSTCVGEPFQRRWEGAGLIFIQIFLPKTVTNAVPLGRKLAQVAKLAFRKKKTSGGVTFPRVRINDNLPAEELFYRMNVVAEYEFSELG
jgi:hypothetical protein